MRSIRSALDGLAPTRFEEKHLEAVRVGPAVLETPRSLEHLTRIHTTLAGKAGREATECSRWCTCCRQGLGWPMARRRRRTVRGHLFPDDETALIEMALEARDSRLGAGTHVLLDNNMGATGGTLVGRLVIASAEIDHAAKPPTLHW